ncbi:MAG: MFS transporter [Burkholderiales bacterium]|nr:MFS transporter [Burkholderiales bacterium]MDE2394302.1 MFS transporter [Burkholderiales bacterium]
MTALELRASITLASIYGLRMLGLFLILPVFSIYAATLPNGNDHALVGLALGIYGMTQALLQIPFGFASDRFGRKNVMMVGLAVFAAGSFMAGSAHTMEAIIVGRAVQGAGAISAAISAMIADSTRAQHRTKAMAMVGMTIGTSFIVSLVGGPLLFRWIGVPGMFDLTGVLALVAIGVVRWVVPDVPMAAPAEGLASADARASVFAPPLLRLHFSIFCVNFMQMAMFVVVPLALLHDAGIETNHHWMVYLPVTLGSFLIAVPGIIWAESRGHMRAVFVSAVLLLAAVMFGFAFGYDRTVPLIAALFFFFVGFNVMEALIPSLVSRTAPVARKGLAMGVYNTAQSLGLFAGGALGGLIAKVGSDRAVFLACAALALAWTVVAWFIQPPPRHAG